MKIIKACKIRWLGIILAALAPINVSYAALDQFQPYAFARVLHDSNLFRLSGEQEAISVIGTDQLDETITYLGAGLETDLKISRQHVLVSGEVQRVKYDTYGELDHTAYRANANWQWVVGNRLQGSLNGRYDKSLSSFNEQQTPEKDMKTQKGIGFNAGYELTPDWDLALGLSASDVSFSKREQLDRRSDSAVFNVLYRNTLNTRVGIRTRYTQYDLKNTVDINGTAVSNDYDEYEISGVLFWEGTAKSKFEARLGYTGQQYDELAQRDYEGTTGRLSYFWNYSTKTNFTFDVWQETSTLTDEITTYVLSRGIRVVPSWSVTPFITLSGEVSYENDDFKGRNSLSAPLATEKREDDTVLYSITARWKPRKFFSLSLGYRIQNRDSTIDSADYDDKQIHGQARFTF